MGCDIHAYVETKQKSSWKHRGRIWYTWRHYEVFGLLAGVRVPFKPIVKLRGIPKDATKETLKALNEYGLDAHSRTWYMCDELLNWDREIVLQPKKNSIFSLSACEWTDADIAQERSSIIKNYNDFMDVITELIEDTDKTRIVMFFDN